MEVKSISNRQADNAFTASDLVTLANNKVLQLGTGSGSHVIQVAQEATGNSITWAAEKLGGDNESIDVVTPQFYGKATAGTMCVAYVDSITWADQNLQDYEFCSFAQNTSPYPARLLVKGVMSVTADQAYDPFDRGGAGGAIVGTAVCYTGIEDEIFD